MFCARYSRLFWVDHTKIETLITNPLIHFYINKINNRLKLKIKYGYKLELKTPETMLLFDRTK